MDHQADAEMFAGGVVSCVMWSPVVSTTPQHSFSSDAALEHLTSVQQISSSGKQPTFKIHFYFQIKPFPM